MEKKKNDIPDWKKQIDNMKTNERDELKSLQRKQGKDSWKKKKELDKLKYDNSVKRNKKITMEEKKALVKELKEFSKTTIKVLDDIIIPE